MPHSYNQWLKKMTFLIFIVTLSIIIALNFFQSRGYQSAEQASPPMFNFITFVAASIIAVALVINNEKIIKLIDKLNNRVVVVLLLVVSIILQAVVIGYLNVNPTWDFGSVVNSSKSLIENGSLESYFIRYPNNILLVIILAAVGKIFSADLFVYQVMNVLVITLSQFLIYRISNKIAGKNIALIALVVSVFFFPYIFFAPIVYTDTISLIFLLLPLNLLIDKNGNFNKRISMVLPASILFSLGMLLKGSLIIFLIAFSIVLFLYSVKWRKIYFIIPFIILLIVKSLFNFGIYQSGILEKDVVERYSFPVTHWLWMGQNPTRYGKFASEDVNKTDQLLKKMPRDEVAQIQVEELKKRIREKGLTGNLQYTLEKISHTWTDGTYYSLNKLKRSPLYPENIQKLIDFNSGHMLQSFARIEHLILMAGLLRFCRIAWKKDNELFTFSMLSIIGFFLFFILWEARSRYLVSLTPLIILMSTLGFFYPFRRVEK